MRRKKELTAGPHLSVEGRGGGGRRLPLLRCAIGRPTRERKKGEEVGCTAGQKERGKEREPSSSFLFSILPIMLF